MFFSMLNKLLYALIPAQMYFEKSKKTSEYKGVTLHKQSKKWYVGLWFKDGKKKYGGTFNDELDAAKRVNELCVQLGIHEKNPGINGIPNQHWKVNCHIILLNILSSLNQEGAGLLT